VDCRRCEGSGKLRIRRGKPDPNRDTHETYDGLWCLTIVDPCPVCYGSGVERDKPNPIAGWRIHLDDEGRPTTREEI
jgi:hypothetical protein